MVEGSDWVFSAPGGVGERMYELASRLYPICRSITGEGVRETLRCLKEHIPLQIHEVPSGTQVFDWTIPKEWNIKDAYVKSPGGKKVIDFAHSNLHVLNYSVPVNLRISLDELKKHLHTLPERPDWIPYRTSYYNEAWGFCLSHRALEGLEEGDYEVCIDSSLQEGQLTYGEYFIKGETQEEVLISTHVCHPSLANDNLSGIVLATILAEHLSEHSLKHSFRFLFSPGTIGSIAWLSLNEKRAERIRHGLVLACVGDGGHCTYKKSRRGADVDRAAIQALKESGDPYEILQFSPFGYDERQFCSPGFNLPVGCFMRTPHSRYPEYHTSADNLSFVQPKFLADSYRKCLSILAILEHNQIFVNENPKCEPQLGKRGLYSSIGGKSDAKIREMAMLWVLNLSDKNHSLLDIAEMAEVKFEIIRDAALSLLEQGLLRVST